MDYSSRSGRVEGTLTPPCSKSYAQRALAISLLAEGQTTLRNIDYCQDTRSALGCIRTLGARVSELSPSVLAIEGGIRPLDVRLQVGESGLASRLFTPIAALADCPIRIEGSGSLLHRPMQMMIDPLRRLGVSVTDTLGHLPFEVCGPMRGGEVEVDGSISSQFITGLLLALPMAQEDTILHVSSPTSIPYLEMTIDTAARFGVELFHKEYREFFIPGRQHYQGIDLTIEGDWSAAAMLSVAGAVAGSVRIEHVSMLSKQADTAILDALVRAGALVINEEQAVTVSHRELHGFEFDATNCPDLFPALAVLAAAAEGETRLYGTNRLIHKESNRAEAIYEEFKKLGIEVDLDEPNVMRIQGGKISSGVVHSHDDHRMAMALAVAGLLSDGEVRIEDAECVAKSYPAFFDDLERIRVK